MCSKSGPKGNPFARMNYLAEATPGRCLLFRAVIDEYTASESPDCYGSDVPERDFTRKESPLLMVPSSLTSERKFVPSVG